MRKRTAVKAAGFLAAVFLLAVPVKAEAADKVMEGVYIENTDVSGMTETEVKQAVEEQLEKIRREQADLFVADQRVTVSLADFGIACDSAQTEKLAMQIGKSGNALQRYRMQKAAKKEPIVLELSFQTEDAQVRKVLEEQCVPLNREVVNMGLVKTQEGFQITEGKDGVELDLNQSADHIRSYFEEDYHGGRAGILMQGKVTKAKGEEEELAKVQNLLAKSSTDFSASSADRRKNIAEGAKKINGTVLYPGEEFQMLPRVTPFTEENGYEKAPSYAMGNVVDSYGGGICQVSTTLYLAVLRAELEVTERHNHSMTVSYVKQAMDAAIAESAGKDFRFVNSTEAPVYIEAYTYKGVIGINIYGQETRPENRKVNYISEVLTTTEPETKISADTEAWLGTLEQIQSPHTGYTSELWKVITIDGKEESREKVNSSTYQMSPGVYKVGVKSENAEVVKQVQDAIAQNDLKTIKTLLGK